MEGAGLPPNRLFAMISFFSGGTAGSVTFNPGRAYHVSMQAKLPDINAAIVRARMDALISFAQGNYNQCVASLEAMVSLLPEEYQVRMTNEDYADAIKEHEVWVCPHCQKTVPSGDVIRTTLLVPAAARTLAPGRKTYKAWICPLCDKTSAVAGTNRKRTELRGLYFLGAVPEPPRRTAMINNLQFRMQFTAWFRIARREIENKLGHYRADYVSQYEDETGAGSELEDDETLG